MSAVQPIELSRYRKESVLDAPPVQHGPAKIVHPYYNYSRLLSHNGAYNFLVGGRGLGKTYGAKKLALQRWINRGDMFIYLRRYKEELISRETFFADIQHEFEEWDFRANGNVFEASPAHTRSHKKRDWETIGYTIALSTAQKQKSVAFPRVKLIIFDEFIIEKGMIHYLPDEANVFNNFYSTVDRWQDKTQVLFLANAVSIANPYFLEYGIRPEKDTKFIKSHGGFIICDFPNSDDFANSVLSTRFGQFIAETDYADYAVGNQFADNHQGLIAAKPTDSKHMFNLELKQGWLSFWHDMNEGMYYAQQKLAPGQVEFTILPEKMSEKKTLLIQTDKLIQRLIYAYRSDKMRFDFPASRNVFIDLLVRR